VPGAVAAASTRWAWWWLLAAILAINTFVALSGGVSLWWQQETTSETSSLPGPVQQVLSARPDTSEADVHLLLWFLAGIVAMLAVRTWRSRAIVLAALLAYSALLEAAQSLTANRTAQWSDLAANSLGLMAAAAAAGLVGLFVARQASLACRHRESATTT
jgi:VanZ family protein